MSYHINIMLAPNIRYDKVMIYYFLLYVYQTHDRINVYLIIILLYYYLTFYHILSLFYHAHQTSPYSFYLSIYEKTNPNASAPLVKITKIEIYYWKMYI
jgi:hypothetical protein